MAAIPQFATTPVSATVTISTANTNRDGTTGAYGTVLTAGATGSRVDTLRLNALGTTTAGMLRLFVANALIMEIPVIAITPSATQPAWGADIEFPNGLILAAGAVLKASTHNAESFAITVINGGDF